MKEFYALSTLLLLILVLLLCGAMSAIDELHEQDTYCQMVHDKAWPDYKHTYAADCSKVRNGKG